MSEWEREQDEIRAVGLRATASRVAVLRFVRAGARPLTHAEVADGLAREVWDKATLYRNLTDLSEAGLLRRISLSDGIRFEDIDGHDTQTPVHFVCSACDAVQCLDPWPFTPPISADFPKALSLGQVEVQIRGVCDRCSDPKKNVP
ncbi:MAG: transcriptional repressor [Myxococcota bacterium]